MEAELKALEEKVGQLVQLCQQLRSENQHLRQQLAASQNESKQFIDKIEGARSRLENLLQQIPEDEQPDEETEA